MCAAFAASAGMSSQSINVLFVDPRPSGLRLESMTPCVVRRLSAIAHLEVQANPAAKALAA
jgi:hypothetical protein